MPPLNNEQLVEKAITAAEALATQGRLNPDQGKAFVDYVFQETTYPRYARVVNVKTDWQINKLSIGKRGMVPAEEAKDSKLRRTGTTSKVELTPVEVMLPVEISTSMLEENIEEDKVADHLMKMFAKQFANEIEICAWHGDTLGPAALESDLVDGGDTARYIKDLLLAKFDGWWKKSGSGNVVDALGANIGTTIISKAVRAMPTKFRRQRPNLRLLMASDTWQLWLEHLTGRATPTGDAALAGATNIRPFGLATEEVALFEFNPTIVKHLSLPGTTATSLGFAPIVSGSEVVTLQTLYKTPTTKLVKDTDYEINYTTGMINRKAGTDPLVVKVTFQCRPGLILTPQYNLVVAMGRDITIEKDRDIYSRTDQYAITAKIAFGVEEDTAVVQVKNMGEAA